MNTQQQYGGGLHGVVSSFILFYYFFPSIARIFVRITAITQLAGVRIREDLLCIRNLRSRKP